MRKTLVIASLSFVAGVLATLFVVLQLPRGPLRRSLEPRIPTTCYSCIWDGYGAQVRNDAIEFYRQYRSSDPLVMADVKYILWRASSNPNCDSRNEYRAVANTDSDPQRRFIAAAVLGVGAPECGEDGKADLRLASKSAKDLGLTAEAATLDAAARGMFHPALEPTEIRTSLQVPAGAKTMILGSSRIEIARGMRIGAQVDRVARDWVSYQLKWDLTQKPLPSAQLISYHEGALLREVVAHTAAEVYPLPGALIAKLGDQWYGADEQGRFRFAILGDKVQYPTSHEDGTLGAIEDTHGISAIAGQAIERHMQLVVGCGDSEGKAKAADYLSQRGIHVVFPGDRYQDLLLGYTGTGVLLGTAPVKQQGNVTVMGDQPVKFSMQEAIIVEDTRRPFPVQYYDAPARYFRKLSSFAPVKVTFVNVDGPDELDKVLKAAQQAKANAVGVRITTLNEAVALRHWLEQDARHRAVLFHSGLYPYAQPLFRDFPQQVTFGDLRPRFE